MYTFRKNQILAILYSNAYLSILLTFFSLYSTCYFLLHAWLQKSKAIYSGVYRSLRPFIIKTQVVIKINREFCIPWPSLFIFKLDIWYSNLHIGSLFTLKSFENSGIKWIKVQLKDILCPFLHIMTCLMGSCLEVILIRTWSKRILITPFPDHLKCISVFKALLRCNWYTKAAPI